MYVIGGVDDHVHLLIQVPATMAMAKALVLIKANSSRWAGEEGHRLTWQQRYGAFSVSASVVPSVIRYIQNREAHHRKMSFDEEFLSLLKKHGVAFDSKFVWVVRCSFGVCAAPPALGFCDACGVSGSRRDERGGTGAFLCEHGARRGRD